LVPLLSGGGIIVFDDPYSNIPTDGIFEGIIDFSKCNALNFTIPPSSTKRIWENANRSLCISQN